MPTEDAIEIVLADPSRLQPEELIIKSWAEMTPYEKGEVLYNGLVPEDRKADLASRTYAACSACHSLDGSKLLGPSFKGRWGKTAVFAGGEAAFDEAYVAESVRNPTAKIAAGYPPVMVAFEATDEELDAIVAFLKEQR